MKKILSVILAVLILVCPLSVFASQPAETLEWCFCGETDYCFCGPSVYNYKGEITLGETEIEVTDEEEYYTYYTFNAENEGYYYIECDNYEIPWFGFPAGIVDGKAILTADYIYVSKSNVEKKVIFKLNEGETFFGIDFNDEINVGEKYDISIEYLGKEISDIAFEEGTFDNLVIDYDLFNTDGSYVKTDVDIIFPNGRTLTAHKVWVQIDDNDYNWTKGENEATAYFLEFEKSVVVTACEMTDLVTDVEFVNYDEFKNVVTKYSDLYADDIYGAELVFTLANGEKVSINTNEDDYIIIDGREIYTYAVYFYNSAEDVEIKIIVGNSEIESYKCEANKTSYIEGSGMLLSDIAENLKDSFYYSRVAFSELLTMYDASYFADTMYYVFYYFERSLAAFANCFEVIKSFVEFYF